MLRKNIVKFNILGFVFVFLLTLISCNDSSNTETPQNYNSGKQDIAAKEDSIRFENLNSEELPNTIYYILDTVKSKIEWSCDKHSGYVKFKTGKIGVAGKNIITGTFVVAMDSIVDLDIDYYLMKGTLEKILKSADFFNTEKYPTSVFKIDSAKKLDNTEYLITGFMKIFDVINPVSFNSKLIIKKDTIVATSQKFSIDRTKWGLSVYTKDHIKNEEGFIVPNEIYLKIRLVALKRRK